MAAARISYESRRVMQASREDELAVRVAITVAKAAWETIGRYYGGLFEVHQKPDGPATTADREADRLIAEKLQEVFPASEYGYLSEETEHGFVRLRRERVWIIDPIDGTHDFIDGTGQFCIQIGLARRLEGAFRPVASVVYEAVAGRIFSALLGRGAWVESAAGNEKPRRLRVSRRKKSSGLRAVMSRSHRTEALDRLMESLRPASALSTGSVGLKLCRLALGEADFYPNLSLGGTKEWDTCAPELILTEAGGRMTDLRGGALRYNRRNVDNQYGLLASNGACHQQILSAIREHFSDPRTLAPRDMKKCLGIRTK
jgi:3'(2'), 5'-bisphosphate nucleotidase